jgi:hypothetical protein
MAKRGLSEVGLESALRLRWHRAQPTDPVHGSTPAIDEGDLPQNAFAANSPNSAVVDEGASPASAAQTGQQTSGLCDEVPATRNSASRVGSGPARARREWQQIPRLNIESASAASVSDPSLGTGPLDPSPSRNDAERPAGGECCPRCLLPQATRLSKKTLPRGPRKSAIPTYKAHIDGYDLGPWLNLRYGNWKLVFQEQRAPGAEVWEEPFVELRFPKLFNLRMDPFERADHESIDYWHWRAERVYMLVPAQAYVFQWLWGVGASAHGKLCFHQVTFRGDRIPDGRQYGSSQFPEITPD